MTFPTGTVTFLFTDIEGSTKLWETQPDVMQIALARHDVLMQTAIETNGGTVFKTIGDAFCAAFATAANGLEAAVAAQQGLYQIVAEVGADLIKVRMALHTGAAEQHNLDYFGQPLNRVARLLAAGHGGQVLFSRTTYDLVRDNLPTNVSFKDMGEHRLRDLQRSEQVFQLCHPDLPDFFPPLKSLDNLPNNLPRQVTSFIGREKEVNEVKEILGKTHLLTLTGSGGTGKTRLSMQVAAEVLDRYPNGVWLVELAPLSDPALVAPTVAEALSLREAPGEPILKTLLAALREKQALLVLDNCEHLLEASARLVDAVLKSCAKVLVMVSSREALGIGGETTYRVPSLSVPPLPPQERFASDVKGDPGAVSPLNRSAARGADLTPASLLEYESVRLFVERAIAVKTDFTVTELNVSALASVCHRLDGIPLAIELAAARVRAMPLDQIETRLDGRFRLLTGGSRTALPRQQTLRALIDWSYDLLNEAEKLLLARLSVFGGGWTADSAEVVCSGEGIEDWEVLDLLTSLVDKSLVVYEEEAGNARYRLLESVRQYALDRLEEGGESNIVRGRHLTHFLAFVQEAYPMLAGPEQGEWLARLEAEHGNLRTGLEWSLGSVGSSESLQLCGALGRFWRTLGHLSEGRAWCERALCNASTTERTKERALAHSAAGALAIIQGDYVAARDNYEESLAISREIGDRSGFAASLNSLGTMAYQVNDHASAVAYLEEGLAINREIGHRRGIANVSNNLGSVVLSLGDHAVARTYLEESLTIFRETGDLRGTAAVLHNLAKVAHSVGDYAAARTYLEEDISNSRAIGARADFADSLEAFAALIAKEGRLEHAAAVWGAAEALREEIGAPLSPVHREEYSPAVAEAREAIDEEAFSAAWERGRAMTMEEAISLALEHTSK